MKVFQVWAWVVAAVYFGVAATGGSAVGAAAAIACGWFAGRRAALHPTAAQENGRD